MKNKTTKKYFYARVLADTNLYMVELGDHLFKYGEPVVIQTEFGQDIAFISSFLFETPNQQKVYTSGKMLRYATEEDKILCTEKYAESREVRNKVEELIKDLSLNMHITHILLPLIGKNMVIYYVATERVDFRELLKRLKAVFSDKITMRQISSQERLNSFGNI